jgi:hypothetical protein
VPLHAEEERKKIREKKGRAAGLSLVGLYLGWDLSDFFLFITFFS